MIETHAHIYDQVFDEDRPEMIKRALERGVAEIWMPNCNSETLPLMLACETEIIKPMIGLHPCYVKEGFETELAIVEEQLASRPYFMIGEIGLDFYWDLNFKEQQEKAFLEQLALAKKYDIPICIHSRNAFERCCELIEQFGWPGLRGIFHCFSGNLNDAQRAIDLNFLIGIGGVVTFKNGGIQEWLGQCPLEKIVLETDCPYLAPVPYRGKRNEVAFLDIIATKIGDCFGVDKSYIIHQTSLNAKNLIEK